MNEMLVHNTLEGEVSLESIRRPGIKLNTKPRIVICLPIGTKQKANVFLTPDGERWMCNSAAIPATVPIQWVMAHMRMVVPLGISTSYLAQWGLLSGEARQIMTMRALNMVQDDGYILYWDDDVIVEPLSLYTLYSFMEQNPQAGMVTGVYSTRQEPTEPVVYKEHMKGSHWGLTVGENAKPEEIFAAGAGFMLCRASAIRDMVKLYEGKPIWADSKTIAEAAGLAENEVRFTSTWGHDIRFCRIMAESGWKLYVDGRVELGHFDAVEQKEYRLPEDSAPKVRGRQRQDVPRLHGGEKSICLILPTYGHFDYAEKAVRSFMDNTRGLNPVVCAVDDGSPDMTNEQFAAWCTSLGIQYFKRFEDNDGLTRSWNYGLSLCRDAGIAYAVCGNSDLIFSPGWDIGITAALATYDLVGPVSNAPGWGTPAQSVEHWLPGARIQDSAETLEAIAHELRGREASELEGCQVGYGSQGAQIIIPEFLNGFCLVARTETWMAGAFDRDNVFDPSNKMTENEVELQTRLVVGQGCRRAIVPSSYVFHYRGISRGDDGQRPSYRAEAVDVAP